MKVAVIGTVGVPANYGGFETLVENLLAKQQNPEIQYAVYCSARNYKEKRWVYKGAKTLYLPFKANGIQSIVYDIVSIVRALRQADVLLILGVSGCLVLPLVRLFYKKRIIVNIDGLEHRRAKWKNYVRKFLKQSEATAVKNADVIVSDNKGIQDYVRHEYGKESVMIEYGGDHVLCDIPVVEQDVLSDFGLVAGEYAMALCRIEPENNVEMILEAFSQTSEKLLFIGNWSHSEFGRRMMKTYADRPNLIIHPAVYDIVALNVLRANCRYYLHGHSAGGTNPSLVEAMFFGRPVFAFDVVYNRETTEGKACYFSSMEELKRLLTAKPIDGKEMEIIARRRYTWDTIVRKYEALYNNETEDSLEENL